MVVYYYSKVFKGYFPLFVMAKKEIHVYECTCERCGHQWITRATTNAGAIIVPIVCPKCKSPYWDIPKNKK